MSVQDILNSKLLSLVAMKEEMIERLTSHLDENPITISTQILPLIEWSNYPKIYNVILVGDINEKKPRFSELLLEAKTAEGKSEGWRNWYHDNRSYCIISDRNFPNLKTLIIQDDTSLGRLDISCSKLEQISIKNLSELYKLQITTPLHSLEIEGCENLVHMNINTQRMRSYQLKSPLQNGISEIQNLQSQEFVMSRKYRIRIL